MRTAAAALVLVCAAGCARQHTAATAVTFTSPSPSDVHAARLWWNTASAQIADAIRRVDAASTAFARRRVRDVATQPPVRTGWANGAPRGWAVVVGQLAEVAGNVNAAADAINGALHGDPQRSAQAPGLLLAAKQGLCDALIFARRRYVRAGGARDDLELPGLGGRTESWCVTVNRVK